jgi:hypothetical protein
MFKKLAILTTLSLVHTFMYAQVKNAVSVNFSSPIIQAINKNVPDTTNLNQPINIAYQHKISKDWLLRVGFGGNNNRQVLTSDIFTNRTEEYAWKLTGLLSLFKVTQLNTKWAFGIGPTLRGIYNRKEILRDSGFDIVNDYSYSKGGGVGAGVFFNYNVHPRVSLYSEYHMVYNLYNTATGKEFSAFPDQNYARNKHFNHGLQLQFPLAIYLNYSFSK